MTTCAGIKLSVALDGYHAWGNPALKRAGRPLMLPRRQMQRGDLRVGGAPEIAPSLLAVFEALKDEKSPAGGNDISGSQAGIVHGALIGQLLFFIRRLDLGRARLRPCDKLRGSRPRIL